MSDLEKAARQALDALEHSSTYHFDRKRNDEALAALRAALEQAEPVVDAVLAERKACMDLCAPYINSLNERVSLAALNIFDAIRARGAQAEPVQAEPVGGEVERLLTVCERRPHGWKTQQAELPQSLVSDVEYLRIFDEARKGSDRPAGKLRGIRAVIAAYESATPKQAEPVDKALTNAESQVDKERAEPVVDRAMQKCSLCGFEREDACEILNCGLRDWGKR